ncbi:MAG: M23 family metallopeptidase [Flavobacterium sp.]
MKFPLVLLFFTTAIFAQTDYPKEYFKSPVDIPLLLSGNFGELRKNHFHSGLDIKTQQREGLNVFAVADGYVSRIKISTFGYGKAIYITHPNGFTSVYGHLQKAAGNIEDYIKSKHYSLESFEMDLKLNPDELPVKQCDLIGFSGNSGGSGGPHLHFEIRDSNTEEIINPLLFGYNSLVFDHKRPVLNSLKVYPLDDNSVVNESKVPFLVNLFKQSEGVYIAENIKASGKIGFSINAIDFFDFTSDTNGLYKVQSFLNGKPSFGYQFENFSFDQSRYINALLDYPVFMKTNQRFQKLFMKNPYPLNIIKTDEKQGIIEVLPNLNSNYTIELSDFHGNKVLVNIPISYSNLPAKASKAPLKSNYFLKASIDNIYKKDKVSVSVPANAFYEDFYLNFDVKADKIYFHDDSVALHKDISVSIEDTLTTNENKDKIFIASVKNGKLSYNSTKLKENQWVIYTKNLGEFTLAKDLVSPTIKPSNFQEGQWLSNQLGLQLEINDNLSGIKTYNGYLNGKWILFEYDYKTKKIIHLFDNAFLVDGKNELKVEVTDNVKNSAIFETYFYYKKK